MPSERNPTVLPSGATGMTSGPTTWASARALWPSLYSGLTISKARQSGSVAEYGLPVEGFVLLSPRTCSFGHSLARAGDGAAIDSSDAHPSTTTPRTIADV